MFNRLSVAKRLVRFFEKMLLSSDDFKQYKDRLLAQCSLLNEIYFQLNSGIKVNDEWFVSASTSDENSPLKSNSNHTVSENITLADNYYFFSQASYYEEYVLSAMQLAPYNSEQNLESKWKLDLEKKQEFKESATLKSDQILYFDEEDDFYSLLEQPIKSSNPIKKLTSSVSFLKL